MSRNHPKVKLTRDSLMEARAATRAVLRAGKFRVKEKSRDLWSKTRPTLEEGRRRSKELVDMSSDLLSSLSLRVHKKINNNSITQKFKGSTGVTTGGEKQDFETCSSHYFVCWLLIFYLTQKHPLFQPFNHDNYFSCRSSLQIIITQLVAVRVTKNSSGALILPLQMMRRRMMIMILISIVVRTAMRLGDVPLLLIPEENCLTMMIIRRTNVIPSHRIMIWSQRVTKEWAKDRKNSPHPRMYQLPCLMSSFLISFCMNEWNRPVPPPLPNSLPPVSQAECSSDSSQTDNSYEVPSAGDPWFRPDLSRADAERHLLSGLTEGSFVIRLGSSCHFPYSLSLLYGGRVYHLNIRKAASGSSSYSLGKGTSLSTPSRTFDSIRELILYYANKPLLLVSGRKTAAESFDPKTRKEVKLLLNYHWQQLL